MLECCSMFGAELNASEGGSLGNICFRQASPSDLRLAGSGKYETNRPVRLERGARRHEERWKQQTEKPLRSTDQEAPIPYPARWSFRLLRVSPASPLPTGLTRVRTAASPGERTPATSFDERLRRARPWAAPGLAAEGRLLLGPSLTSAGAPADSSRRRDWEKKKKAGARRVGASHEVAPGVGGRTGLRSRWFPGKRTRICTHGQHLSTDRPLRGRANLSRCPGTSR